MDPLPFPEKPARWWTCLLRARSTRHGAPSGARSKRAAPLARTVLAIACGLGAALPLRAGAADPPIPSASTAPPPSVPPPDLTAADALFHDGKAALARGQIAEGCQLFEKSLAIVRRSGVLINLADCRERAGQFATAERLFRQTLDLVIKEGRADREAYAREHLATLAPKLAWLEFSLTPDAVAAGVVVTCEDVTVAGAPIAVDPGAHVVTVVDRTGARAEVPIPDVRAGERRTVRIERPGATVAPTATSGIALDPGAPATAAARAPIPAWLAPAGTAALGLGTAALGAGLVLSARAFLDDRASRALCPESPCPSARGLAKNDAARAEALGASIAVPTGLVFLAAGATLVALAGPPRTAVSKQHTTRGPGLVPGLGPQGGGLWLTGTF